MQVCSVIAFEDVGSFFKILILGLLFFCAGVHDSYWTHACDVDEMNRILREKFVELYEKPILEDVSIILAAKLESYFNPLQ